jgi:hypothetical protein
MGEFSINPITFRLKAGRFRDNLASRAWNTQCPDLLCTRIWLNPRCAELLYPTVARFLDIQGIGIYKMQRIVFRCESGGKGQGYVGLWGSVEGIVVSTYKIYRGCPAANLRSTTTENDHGRPQTTRRRQGTSLQAHPFLF